MEYFSHARDYNLDAPVKYAYYWDFPDHTLTYGCEEKAFRVEDKKAVLTDCLDDDGVRLKSRIIASTILPDGTGVARVRVPSAWADDHGAPQNVKKQISDLNFFIRTAPPGTRKCKEFWVSLVYYEIEFLDTGWKDLPSDFVKEIRRLDDLVPKGD